LHSLTVFQSTVVVIIEQLQIWRILVRFYFQSDPYESVISNQSKVLLNSSRKSHIRHGYTSYPSSGRVRDVVIRCWRIGTSVEQRAETVQSIVLCLRCAKITVLCTMQGSGQHPSPSCRVSSLRYIAAAAAAG